MRPLPSILLALLICSALAQAKQPTWPQVEGQADLAECRDALALANVAFRSSATFLRAPQALPLAFKSVAVLDVAGNGRLVADPGTFDTLAQDEVPRNVYWQRKAAAGYRIAVRNSLLDWRGDGYTLHMIDPALSLDGFMASLASDPASASDASVIETGLEPPRLYKRPADQQLWALNVEAEVDALSAWAVYTPDAGALRKACTIRFRPAVAHMVDLLPTPVRRLEILLNRAIGRGSDRWSAIYIDLTREAVERTWANAALRPWVTPEPYNSVTEVDQGLAQWARQADNRRLLQDIRRQYPVALRALGRYYRQQFGLAPKAARDQARFILDGAYRSHFVFSRLAREESKSDPDANPWRPDQSD